MINEAKERTERFYNAAKSGAQTTLQEFLLEYKIEADVINTAMHIAVNGSHSKCLKILLENDANIDHANKNGGTALMLAADKGFKNICGILLDRGAKADLNHKLSNNQSLLERLIEIGAKEHIEKMPLAPNSIEALAKYTAKRLNDTFKNLNQSSLHKYLTNMIESSDDLNPDIYKQIISDIRELINKEEGRYSTLTANIKNSIEKKSHSIKTIAKTPFEYAIGCTTQKFFILSNYNAVIRKHLGALDNLSKRQANSFQQLWGKHDIYEITYKENWSLKDISNDVILSYKGKQMGIRKDLFIGLLQKNNFYEQTDINSKDNSLSITSSIKILKELFDQQYSSATSLYALKILSQRKEMTSPPSVFAIEDAKEIYNKQVLKPYKIKSDISKTVKKLQHISVVFHLFHWDDIYSALDDTLKASNVM